MTDSSLAAQSVADDAWLDQFHIPFGEAAADVLDWLDSRFDWLVSSLEWPFRLLIDNIVQDVLLEISWVWVVLAVSGLAWLVRGLHQAGLVAVALVTSGFLGDGFWPHVVQTLGVVAVSLALSAVVAVPLGVATSRSKSLWRFAQPLLWSVHAIQPFAFLMLPLFFWGIGATGASAVTALYVLPPLARHVHYGVTRASPELLEMSQSFGASRWRAFLDVELRHVGWALRSAIHDALPHAVLMYGVAALIGGGGFGGVVFQALATQDIALSASAGLAFALVAYVINQLVGRDASDRGLMRWVRIGRSNQRISAVTTRWAHRAVGARDLESPLPGTPPN